MVTTKYAAPQTSRAALSPTPPTRKPPTRPPSGMSAKQQAVDSEVTRPISGSGTRS